MNVIKLAVCLSGVVSLTGCAIPLLTGVKSYESGDTKVEFITGADFTVGANGLNSIDNYRGMTADGGFKKNRGGTKQAVY
jgi:hypothetical protein